MVLRNLAGTCLWNRGVSHWFRNRLVRRILSSLEIFPQKEETQAQEISPASPDSKESQQEKVEPASPFALEPQGHGS